MNDGCIVNSFRLLGSYLKKVEGKMGKRKRNGDGAEGAFKVFIC